MSHIKSKLQKNQYMDCQALLAHRYKLIEGNIVTGTRVSLIICNYLDSVDKDNKLWHISDDLYLILGIRHHKKLAPQHLNAFKHTCGTLDYS